MRVHTTLGPLILSAGLCAARACAPHPRSTTTTTTTTTSSSWTSETATSTAIGSTTTDIATTTSGLTSEETTTVTESDTAIESSVTILTSAFETSTVEASTSATEASTSAAEAPTRTTEDSTTTTTSLAQSVQSPPNGDFQDPTLEPWEFTGTRASLARGNYCYEKGQCAALPGPYSGNTAKICQRVEIQQGYEYTFVAYLWQGCTHYDAEKEEDGDCSPNANTVQLSIDGVSFTSKSVDSDHQFHEYSSTFQYTGPSIDSTDLCIAIVITQGYSYQFLVDSVSLVRGKSVPVPEES